MPISSHLKCQLKYHAPERPLLFLPTHPVPLSPCMSQHTSQRGITL